MNNECPGRPSASRGPRPRARRGDALAAPVPGARRGDQGEPVRARGGRRSRSLTVRGDEGESWSSRRPCTRSSCTTTGTRVVLPAPRAGRAAAGARPCARGDVLVFEGGAARRAGSPRRRLPHRPRGQRPRRDHEPLRRPALHPRGFGRDPPLLAFDRRAAAAGRGGTRSCAQGSMVRTRRRGGCVAERAKVQQVARRAQSIQRARRRVMQAERSSAFRISLHRRET